MSITLLVDGFFPRRHPTRGTPVDHGHCGKATCGYCGKEEYVWISIEYCPHCDSFADYWDHGNQDVENHFKQYGAKQLEHNYLEAAAGCCLEQLGLKPEQYSLTIFP